MKVKIGDVYWDKDIQRSIKVDFECSLGFTSKLDYPIDRGGILHRTSTYAYGYNTDRLIKMIEDGD